MEVRAFAATGLEMCSGELSDFHSKRPKLTCRVLCVTWVRAMVMAVVRLGPGLRHLHVCGDL